VLIRRIFNAGERGLEPAGKAEKKAVARLLKAGIVVAISEKCPTCSCNHERYALTLAGRACYAAEQLGLSFPQLCYLACARWAIRHSLFSGESAFFDKDLRPMFGMFFPDLSPTIKRRELTRRGFFEKRTAHVYGMTRRLAELEEKYATIMDELYRGMRAEYKTRFLEKLQDPLVAKMFGSMQKPSADEQDGNVSDGSE
jgi:hypothetical protein